MLSSTVHQMHVRYEENANHTECRFYRNRLRQSGSRWNFLANHKREKSQLCANQSALSFCRTWSVYFVSENFSEFCITCGACQNKNYCLTRGETTILSCTAPRRIFSRGLPVSKWGVLGRHRICENRLEHMFLGCYMWGLHFSGRLYFEKSNRALQVNWPIYATFGASIFGVGRSKERF